MSDPAITAWEPTRLRRGRVAATLLLLVIGLSPDAGASKKRGAAATAPTLHQLPSGGFAFRTPEAWKVVSTPESPDTLNAARRRRGRALRSTTEGETGYDSFHGACMLERLAGAMEMDPSRPVRIRLRGRSDRRPPGPRLRLRGHLRQADPGRAPMAPAQRDASWATERRCASITYAPATLWKKSAPTRALLDAVLASVTFR